MERPRPPLLEPAHCVPTAPSCAVGAQKKFTDLSGAAEHQGDLKSVVLHKMTMNSVQSTFPIALGLRITGVDDATFAQTGESYSTIALPNANSHTARTLQEDNTDLAYEFVSTTALNPRLHRNTLLTHHAPHAGAQVSRVHG